MAASVSDPDGHDDTSCTFIIVDSNGTTVMEAEGPLKPDGTFSANWLAPAIGSPFASTIGCTDPQGQQTAHTREGIIPSEPSVITDDGNGGQENQSTQQESSRISTFVVSIAAILLLLIGVTVAFVTLREREEEVLGEVQEEELSEWAAPDDSRLEGEQSVALSEMAMSELGDSQDLSEEDSPTNEGEPDEVAEVLNSEEDEDEEEQGEIED
jgi:hypothetical protein